MASYSYTFTSGDTLTPTKLNSARTVSNIVNADVSSTAAIVGTKISPDFGSQNAITTGTITGAKLVPTGTSSTGNGLYLPATNTVAVSTNGIERLRVDASGNAAIGTTSTASARLNVLDNTANDAVRITQTGAGNAFVVEDANPDGTPVVITNNGSIVQGHTTAESNWYSSGVAPQAYFVGTANGAGVNGVGVGTFGAVQLARTNSATIDGRGLVASGDVIGVIRFAADDSVSASMIPAAQISASVDGTPGNTDMPGRLAFFTTPDGTGTLTERMRITNAGDVGIGTSAPSSKLQVNGTVTAPEFVGDLTGTADNVANLAITDAKVATGAAIAHSKLATIASGRVLLGNATGVPTATAVTGDVTISNAGVTAIGAGVVVDADISTGANITLSKLGSGALPTDITVASANIVDGTIVNADINNTAGISLSKLANITAGQVLMGNSLNAPTATALSGDVTVSSSGVTAIGAGVVVDADISTLANITLSKLGSGALPTDITVASANLVDGTIVNADVSATAGILGTKIYPDFGSQGIATTGTVTAGKLVPSGTSATGNGMYLPASNQVAISTDGSERLRINAFGTLLMGSTSDVNAANYGFKVVPNGQAVLSRAAGVGSLADFYRADDGTIQYFLRSNTVVGSISVTSTATSYNTSSDYRLKEDIVDLDGGLAAVEAMRPCKYKWKANGDESVGFIAHELQAVVPNAVQGQKNAVGAAGEIVPQGVDLSKLVPFLVGAVQELAARVRELENKK